MKHIEYTVLPLLLAAICLVSCQEKQEAPSYIYPEYSSYSFGHMPDTLQIYVESNVDWNIDREAGWLGASKSEAQDGAQWLTVTVMENSEIEPRTASITLSAGTVSSEITITQKGAEFMGLFENLAEYPYTYGVMSSQNVKYIIGMKEADAEGYYIPEIINVMTGERRELEATDQWDYAVAVSDEGDDYILNSRRFGGYLVCVDGQEMKLTAPEGYKIDGVSVQGMSGDGRVIVGALYSNENGTGRFPCRWVDGECEILERPDTSSYGTPTAPYGTLARDCSADGSVIYGTEWSTSSYALCFWRDGKMFYPGGDYAVKNGYYADRIYKTAEYGALSVNGKWLAASYGKTTGETNPVIINTETYEVSILDNISSDMVGLTCSDDGLLFTASPAMGCTTGHVIDPEAGTSVMTEEWFKSEYGLNLSSGRMIYKVSDDMTRYFGTLAGYGNGGLFSVTHWYINLAPEK